MEMTVKMKMTMNEGKILSHSEKLVRDKVIDLPRDKVIDLPLFYFKMHFGTK